MPTRRPALLLLGPTGSGKTPLGELLEAEGFHGRRCAHFDFGAHLRRIDKTGVAPEGLGKADVAWIRRVLHQGALLENKHFHLARAIFEGFVREKQLGPNHWLVLNGLPRHVGQAADVDAMVDVRAVIYLRCPAEVVRQRICLNTGGDRFDRADDLLDRIAAKLRVFKKRTLPLIEHYRSAGAQIVEVEVGSRSTPQEVLQTVESRLLI
ncbi:MAG: nucleoside monophosphate kinase [Verrucomicrobiae bacterium]|nr:nucleoside monophosphate kinase [Verrucomicrobiae bacterium]